MAAWGRFYVSPPSPLVADVVLYSFTASYLKKGAFANESYRLHRIRVTGCASVRRGRKTSAEGQSSPGQGLRRIRQSSRLAHAARHAVPSPPRQWIFQTEESPARR